MVDLESEGREVLGEYRTTEEDSVSYWLEEDGTLAWAPEDCVAIVAGYRERPGVPAYEVEPMPLDPTDSPEFRAHLEAATLASHTRVKPWTAGELEQTERPFSCSPDESAGLRELHEAGRRELEELRAGRDPRD